MTPGSIPLGKIAGVPVSVHWSAILIVFMFGDGLAEVYGWGVAAIGLVAFLAGILAHEVGHSLTARRFGVNTMSIELWALGGAARLDREAPTARAEGWIAAAGPLTSLVLGGAGIGVAYALDAAGLHGAPVGIPAWLGIVNLLLAVFNMLPGAPLDGGRVFKAWRWGRNGDRFRAGREAANAGQAVGWSLAGIGIVATFHGRPGFVLVITGLFIALSARAERGGVELTERLQGVRVRDLTWFGIAHAQADTDADTMLWQRSRLGEAGIVAVDGADGQLAGIVAEEQLLAVPAFRRSMVTLRSLMVPLHQITRADLDDQLADVLPRLSPRAPYVTVWREGSLLGVIPRRRLAARLRAQ